MEDYLPVYPSLNSPDIQKIITRKKEFQELAALRDESLPAGGGVYNHQKFFVRFMIMADRVINIHEPGTGKTCAFIAAAEHFKGTGSYKRTYIIEKSETLLSSIRTQIIESCAPGVYDTGIVNETRLTRRSIRGRIRKALDDWYKFKTYKRFSMELDRMDDEEIINKYSKSIIILDEVHNILGTNPEGNQNNDDSKDYPQYLRLCRLIRQSKICAVTATPMVNDTSGIVRLINLLLPEGQEMPNNIDNMTLAQMEPFFRGKITFVRASTKAATPVYMGELLPAKYRMTFPDDSDLNQDLSHQAKMITRIIKSGIKVFPTPMGDIQEQKYLSIPYAPFEGKNITSGIFTFPFGSDSDFIKTSRGGRYSWTTPPEFSKWDQRGKFVSFHQWLYNNGDTSNIGRLSGKMKAIIDIERDAPGCSFIYTHLRNFSGAITIAMLFTLFGFEFFNDNLEQVFTSEDSSQVKDSYPKKLRVAVISSGFSQSKQDAILKLIRSDANVNGEYIKIVVGSRTSRDGLNVYHCRRMHLISPQWNFSNMIQATNRVLRAQGHETLRKLLNREAKSLGLSKEAWESYTNVDVKIYRHCIDYKIDELTDSNDDDETASKRDKSRNVDLYMYRYAERKELSIRRVFHAMKICAVDAVINRARNILGRDRDYTQDCDYEPCDYPSWEQLRDREYNPDYELSRPELVDSETYDILYRDTSSLKNSILKRLFRFKSVSYLKIFQEYREKNYEDETIIQTLNNIREMTSERIITRDGDRLFIVLGDNGIHLQRQIDMPTSYIRDLSIYETPNMSLTTRSVSDVFQEMEHSTIDSDIIAVSAIYEQNETFATADSGKVAGKGASKQTINAITKYIEDLPEWRRKSLLEECVLGLKGHNLFKSVIMVKNILDIFKGYYFQFDETDLITRSPVSVYVHIFQSHSSKNKSHNIVARNRDPKEFRIYKSNESLGWRKLIEGEDKYKIMVVKKITSDEEPYSKYTVYGTILQDKKFRVNYNPPNANSNAIVDKRQLKKGMECKSLEKYKLINIAWEEQIYPPISTTTTIHIPKNEQDMRDSLEGTFGRDFIKDLTGAKLQLMYLWNHQPDIVRVMCELLREKLEQTDRIYSPYMLY